MAEIGTDHDVDDWRAAGGNIQSLTFYRTAIDKLKNFEHLAEMMTFKYFGNGVVNYPTFSIHDYGCGHGDGTALLQSAFPMADVRGFDISTTALIEAKRRWPTIDFELGDIRRPKHYAHLIYTSHTIEHFSDPVEVVLKLLEHCELLVCVIPTIDDTLDGGHKGAMPTIDFYTELMRRMRKIFDIDGWSTLRKGGDGKPYVEGNNILILRGSWEPTKE